MKITINLTKAREITHTRRRRARAVELAPLDIAATIPTEAAQAESARRIVRAKYDALQVEIDAAASAAALKAIIERSGL